MRRVLIADDHELERDGLKSLLLEQCAATVFGEASTASDALALVRAQEWDAAVVAISLGDQSGLDVVRDLRELRPSVRILVLSMHSEEQYARRAYQAGAAGYITKDSPRTEVARAFAKVIGGGRYVSQEFAERLVEHLDHEVDAPPHHQLSPREFEVMRLIVAGKAVGEIALVLSLSDRTVSTYRARLLDKMHMKTNAELMHYAIEERLVE